jgi:methionyl-tRNA synthetase
MSKPFYITTTLPYVNADPHVGFALEIVQADVIARYKRLTGTEVFFNTGTDEHGQKIFQKAGEEGKDVQEYVDHYAGEFRKLKELLGLSNDRFIRTTDTNHITAAQELWRRCAAAGDIEKKKYKGLYCVGDEMFLKENDLVNGRCPNHPNMDPIEFEEENYYFKFSKYQDKLLQYLKRDDVILPEWRRQEAIAFVEGGLEDFSISRLSEKMSWGIPVPGDETQVMYVWFDALVNYISTLGWPNTDGDFKKFWEEGEVVQVAGKDQVRFQSIMWQAMLMSANIKNTDKVIYHGFINSGGQKMSKSLGNVLDPYEIVDMFKPLAGELATDVLRYYLLRHVNQFDDSDMTIETLKEAYQANLANGLGNLVSRIMTMAENNSVTLSSEELQMTVFDGGYEYLEKFEIDKFVDEIFNLGIQSLDRYIQREEPFKKIKIDEIAAKENIHHLLFHLYGAALQLAPIMPKTSEKIVEIIKSGKKPKTPLFARLP